MIMKKVLLPHNFSDYDHRALDFVVTMFSEDKDVDITLFNVYSPLPEISAHVHEAPVLDRLKTNVQYLSQKIKEQEKALNDVRQQLTSKGFPPDRVHCIYKPRIRDTANEIIDLATKEHYDLIVINHRYI